MVGEREERGLLACPMCGKQPQRNGRAAAGGVLCRSGSHLLQVYGADQAKADENWNTRTPIEAQERGAAREGAAIFTDDLRMLPEMAGRYLTLRCKVAYSGSRVSDLRFGNQIVQIDNDTIRAALAPTPSTDNAVLVEQQTFVAKIGDRPMAQIDSIDELLRLINGGAKFREIYRGRRVDNVDDHLAALPAPSMGEGRADGKFVTLAACPPGPFLFEGYLGFKTEYNSIRGKDIGAGQVRWEMSNWPDAYCMSSGEAFWGGCKTDADRFALMVLPVDIDPASAVPSPMPENEE